MSKTRPTSRTSRRKNSPAGGQGETSTPPAIEEPKTQTVPLDIVQQLLQQQQQQQEAAERQQKAAEIQQQQLIQLLQAQLAAQQTTESRFEQLLEKQSQAFISVQQSSETRFERLFDSTLSTLQPQIAEATKHRDQPTIIRSDLPNAPSPHPHTSHFVASEEPINQPPPTRPTYRGDCAGITAQDTIHRNHFESSGDGNYSRVEIPSPPPRQIRVPSLHQELPITQNTIHSELYAGGAEELKKVESDSRIMTKTNVRITPFDGSVPWTDYEAQFLVIADGNGWDASARATHLAGGLRGPALSVLSSLSRSEALNYDKLSVALKLRFGNEHLKKLSLTQLNSKKQNKDEDLASLGQEIERLARVAIPESDEMREYFATTAFINAIADSNIKMSLSLSSPTTLRGAIIKALEIEALAAQFGDPKKVRQVTGPERNRTQPNQQVPRATPGQQHRGDYNNTNNRRNISSNQTDNYRQPPRALNENPGSRLCSYCKKTGHLIRDCYSLRNKREEEQRKEREMECQICKKRGHGATTCYHRYPGASQENQNANGNSNWRQNRLPIQSQDQNTQKN